GRCHRAAGGGQHDVARRPLRQRPPQLLFQLADLGRKRGLADEARRRRPPEMQVVGEGDEIGQVAQVHGTAPPGRFQATAAAAACGLLLRMRWSNALSAAFAPSPIAITICLYGTVVASPAANTPGSEVRPAASTTISPRGLSSTVPLSHSVLGSRPIWTNTPSSSTRCESPPTRSR